MKAIVAISERGRVIGKDGKLPWHLPEDLRHFKKKTMGAALLMGKNTWQSLPGVLPGRAHIVLSGSPASSALPEGVRWCQRLETILSDEAAGKFRMGLWVIGGAGLFASTLEHITELHVTWVRGEHEGDVHMPAFEHLFLPPVELKETACCRFVRYDKDRELFSQQPDSP